MFDIFSHKMTNNVLQTNVPQEVKVPKKRGRKPKGGKIITSNTNDDNVIIHEPNVILHLKCRTSDIIDNDNIFSNVKYTPEVNNVDSYQFQNDKTTYFELNNTKNTHNISVEEYVQDNQQADLEYQKENKNNIISRKLQELSINLHTNNISDKKSACFWCTCDFDNPPIYIPKYELNNSYQCYGCFCSPECAVAYLFKEHIDSSTKFERYHLLNHIYCKIYDYTKNIKPAPNPHYTLNKFYGNLTIQEYRRLLKNERLLIVVDKPLSRTLPELYEDNNDFVINSHLSIQSTTNSLNVRVSNKKQTKNEIVQNNFCFK
jgi:hypothetical protein